MNEINNIEITDPATKDLLKSVLNFSETQNTELQKILLS